MKDKTVKKVSKKIKKHLTPITLLFGVLFLVVGIVVGVMVSKTLKQDNETKIELKGENIVYIYKGDTYNEAGYTFIIDGLDCSSEVVVSNNVDSDTIGQYVITYTLVTKEHNVVLTRVVNVVGGVSDGQN